MAQRIRRNSMERLELYDLDQLKKISSKECQLGPPLPPRIDFQHRRASINPSYERYQFLCDASRIKTDPIYAATPMFTTIPESYYPRIPRRLIGSFVCSRRIQQLIEKHADGMTREKTNDTYQRTNHDDHFGTNCHNELSPNDERDRQVNIDASNGNDDDDDEEEEEEEHKNIVDNDDDKNNQSIIEQMLNQDRKDQL